MSNVQLPVTTNEIFCFSCGASIKKEAEICPKCGVRQKKQMLDGIDGKAWMAITSLVIGIIGLFLGAIGIVTGTGGLILGIMGLKSDKRGMSIAGIILNSLAIFLGIIFGLLSLALATMSSSIFGNLFRFW